MYNLGTGSTNTEFTVYPSSQAAIYGRIVDFVCQIPTCSESLFIQVNNTIVVPYMNFSDTSGSQRVRLLPGLDPREYGGDVKCVGENYTVRFWITVNDKTLKAVNHVNCKIGGHTVSDNAYISVLYPETLRESACENQEPQCMCQNTTNCGSNLKQESELTMITLCAANKSTKPAASLIIYYYLVYSCFYFYKITAPLLYS